jgi:hypothetical protein
MTKRNHYDDEGDEIVKDGEGIRCSMMMLDHGLDDVQLEIAGTSRQVRFTDGIGRSHQPGHRFLSASSGLQDAAETAEGARLVRKRQIADAWRTLAAWRLGRGCDHRVSCRYAHSETRLQKPAERPMVGR